MYNRTIAFPVRIKDQSRWRLCLLSQQTTGTVKTCRKTKRTFPLRNRTQLSLLYQSLVNPAARNKLLAQHPKLTATQASNPHAMAIGKKMAGALIFNRLSLFPKPKA
jgi:hypothetical protein